MKAGFTILECLIYLSLMALTSVLIANMGINFFETTNTVFKRTDTYLSLYIVTEHIAHDICRAPTDKKVWEVSANGLSWQGAQRHVWKLKDKRIFRSEGHETSAVADGIDALDFQLMTEGPWVVAVQCTVRRNSITLSRYMPLYERMVACTL